MYGQIGQTEYIINKVKEETGMSDPDRIHPRFLSHWILKDINLVYRKQNRKGVK